MISEVHDRQPSIIKSERILLLVPVINNFGLAETKNAQGLFKSYIFLNAGENPMLRLEFIHLEVLVMLLIGWDGFGEWDLKNTRWGLIKIFIT